MDKKRRFTYADVAWASVYLVMACVLLCLTVGGFMLETKLAQRDSETKRRAREELEESTKDGE